MSAVLDVDEVRELDNERLEGELTGWAAALAAATYRLLTAVVEYDRREAWKRCECSSMAHWLSWKCGMSAAAAKEHVRVGRALTRLPHVSRLFKSGELSYSQVRAITRIATPRLERSLIDVAQHSTAAQLEVIVRAYRRVTTVGEDTAKRRHQRRLLRWHYDNEGCLVGTFRLPPERGAVLVDAVSERVDQAAIIRAGRTARRIQWPRPGPTP